MAGKTPAEVAAFLDRELLALPRPLKAENLTIELARMQALLERAEWTFAKTMPENPHHYTLRQTWEREEFFSVVESIRRHGIRTTYRGWPYVELHIGGFFYWTMGWPIRETTLINRKSK